MAHDNTTGGQQPVSFKDTLNLPRTDFPIRPQPKVDDPEMLKRWEKEKLYEKAYYSNQGSTKYILHDGPPYANGSIHLGHAYNKVLKDIMTKAHRMLGLHVPVKPGWDCHGLPIELKVTQERPGLSALELKRACRDYAQKWIDIQRAEFKRLGVVMEWDHPYITMGPHYEAAVIRAFGVFVEKGFIERKNKTVAWCSSCQTTLATAEIEYKERKDPSIYVLFPFGQQTARKLFPEVGGREVNLLVWTTTPWTLPLNRAVMLRAQAQYRLSELNGRLVITGAQVADEVAALIGSPQRMIKEFPTEYLTGSLVQHPFLDNLEVPLLAEEDVALGEGTACVHIAPGCGPQDYEVGVKHQLEVYSPISPRGTYEQGVEPEELAGVPVAEAQGWVIKRLAEVERLFYKTSLMHSFPHCWRCHSPLIFRATRQWFFDLNHSAIKQQALEAIKKITFIPEQARSFLYATVESRWEWSLSRQRVWGVPIPALICNECDVAYCTPGLVNQVAENTAREGIEYWDRVLLDELVPANFACPRCKKSNFRKETDILDVWFDSGVSHYAVLYGNPELGFPADLYLEGIDQHRGWFQSSLLTSLVLEEEPAMRAIMTHGFTVDAKGQKMSKSLGNVVAPQQIIDRLGTDGLRLWVASIGHEGDAVVSETLLRNVGEVYRKIRNTCRFLLQNLYDFDKTTDALDIRELRVIDQAALAYLYELNRTIIREYLDGNFTAVFHTLADYCSSELSSFYLDIVKDRLYVEAADGKLRRSAQTTLWYILDTLTRLIAPIVSFTAEQLSDYYQKDKKESIHLQLFSHLRDIWHSMAHEEVNEKPLGLLPASYFGHIVDTERAIEEISWISKHTREWELLKDIRSAVLKAIELQREKGLIKHSLEAQVTLFINKNMKGYDIVQAFYTTLDQAGESHEEFYKEFFIVSQVALAHSAEGLEPTVREGLYARIDHAQGTKCPRCWQWEITTNPYGLCRRCQEVLKVQQEG